MPPSLVITCTGSRSNATALGVAHARVLGVMEGSYVSAWSRGRGTVARLESPHALTLSARIRGRSIAVCYAPVEKVILSCRWLSPRAAPPNTRFRHPPCTTPPPLGYAAIGLVDPSQLQVNTYRGEPSSTPCAILDLTYTSIARRLITSHKSRH